MEVNKETLLVDLNNLPEGTNIEDFLKEFEESWREWTQISMNEFINSKIEDAKI